MKIVHVNYSDNIESSYCFKKVSNLLVKNGIDPKLLLVKNDNSNRTLSINKTSEKIKIYQILFK